MATSCLQSGPRSRPRSRLGSRWFVSWLALAVAILIARSATASDAVPRYRFEVGQHLSYEGDEVVLSGGFGVERSTELWVVAERPAGGWHVLVSQVHRRFSERGGERKDHAPRYDVFVVDVMPDGTIPQRALDSFDVLNRVVPVLPPNAAAGRTGWTFDAGDVRHAGGKLAREAGADGGRWTFEVVPTSERDEVNGFSTERLYTLDAAVGLIVGHASKHYHKGKQTRRGTERLTRRETLAPADAEALAHDVEAYERTRQAYRRTRARALGASMPDDARRRLAEGLARLEALQAAMTSPVMREHAGRLVAQHHASARYFDGRIQLLAQLIGRPAPSWTLSDIDGRPRRLEDYRGRIVVLDFWYRACGWCVRAMPQIQAVADRFDGRPVAVLGMNVDKSDADARFIVDRMKPTYTTIRADRTLAARHGVRGYPTLLVLDGQGLIRMVHSGYSATLAEELGDFVEELIAEDAVSGSR